MEVPFALSISHFISSVGADAGFAAFIGVAIMALLYFAQARETSTLRQRLEEAHDRIGGLEARIAQLMHLQSSRQQSAAPAPQALVTPPPASARPMGSAVASVRRIPAAAAPVTAATGARALPSAPVGMGAPALASATKLIPDPVLNPAAATDDTMLVPGAANGNGEAATTAATTAAAGARRSAAPAAGPPRVQIRPEAAGAGPVPRRPAVGQPPAPVRPGGSRNAPARPRGEERFEVFDNERRGLRDLIAGRAVPLGIAAAAIIVILIGVVVIEGRSSGTPSPANHNASGSTANTAKHGTNAGTKHHAPAAFVASSVKVAVLNGTSVGHLAADVANKLARQGYKRGSITNAASQSQPTTIVYFASSRFKTAADHVADVLKVSLADVRPAGGSALKACATTPTGATTSCVGNVIVSVGQDRANLASSSSSAG